MFDDQLLDPSSEPQIALLLFSEYFSFAPKVGGQIGLAFFPFSETLKTRGRHWPTLKTVRGNAGHRPICLRTGELFWRL